mmetsp:Transcript_28371/g.68195  ORF Transcript_28371/g.68195 Transcript_28371/m.68195 type:complete len:313 (-) Transcript_28371:1212-2150(-)
MVHQVAAGVSVLVQSLRHDPPVKHGEFLLVRKVGGGLGVLQGLGEEDCHDTVHLLDTGRSVPVALVCAIPSKYVPPDGGVPEPEIPPPHVVVVLGAQEGGEVADEPAPVHRGLDVGEEGVVLVQLVVERKDSHLACEEELEELRLREAVPRALQEHEGSSDQLLAVLVLQHVENVVHQPFEGPRYGLGLLERREGAFEGGEELHGHDHVQGNATVLLLHHNLHLVLPQQTLVLLLLLWGGGGVVLLLLLALLLLLLLAPLPRGPSQPLSLQAPLQPLLLQALELGVRLFPHVPFLERKLRADGRVVLCHEVR